MTCNFETDADMHGITFVAVDVETTGFNAKTDRVIEIGAVRFTPDGNVLERWGTLVNPADPEIPEHVGASDIHGITPGDLAGAPGFGDIVGDLARMCKGAILVAHNASFDTRFIRAELERAGHRWPNPATMDTLGAARWLLPNLENHKLATVAAWFDVTFDGDAHAAVVDAQVCAEIHTRMLQMTRHMPWEAIGYQPGGRWPDVNPSGKTKPRHVHLATT